MSLPVSVLISDRRIKPHSKVIRDELKVVLLEDMSFKRDAFIIKAKENDAVLRGESFW